MFRDNEIESLGRNNNTKLKNTIFILGALDIQTKLIEDMQQNDYAETIIFFENELVREEIIYISTLFSETVLKIIQNRANNPIQLNTFIYVVN